jgi:hypothetical protein
MIFKLKKGARFQLGGHPIVLNEDAEFDFVEAPNLDAVAEMLAADQSLFGQHLADLAHEDDSIRHSAGEGGTTENPVRVMVTYGAHGIRQEEVLTESTEDESSKKKSTKKGK